MVFFSTSSTLLACFDSYSDWFEVTLFISIFRISDPEYLLCLAVGLQKSTYLGTPFRGFVCGSVNSLHILDTNPLQINLQAFPCYG